MNKVYRIIWSHAHNAFVVVSEMASATGKKTRSIKAATAVASTLLASTAIAAPAANELPTGGQLVSGQATISQSGSAMTIQQDSSKAIINWNTFNIGSEASVNFQQQSSSSVALNRVIGSEASSIYGALNANGQVYLINPNGVLFAPGAQVNVGGLVASTLNISDEDFLNGNNQFSRDGGATGGILNQGSIDAQYVALLAPEVINEGIIKANMGTVAMAAGEAVSLDITGNRLVGVQVDQASIDTLVENRHLVQANDGTVIMSARSAYDLLGQVVNTGAIEAQGLVNDGGVVRLLASSNIDHSGSINVDGGTNGNGGDAILFADLDNTNSETRVSGAISARGGEQSGDGGFIETSGSHLNIADSATIDTSAPNGATGQWLLDPYDFTIAASGGDITGSALTTALESNNVTIETTGADASCNTDPGCSAGDSAGNGDIFVNDAITIASTSGSSNSLILRAYRNIEINADVTVGTDGTDGELFMYYGTADTDGTTDNFGGTGTGGWKKAAGVTLDAFNSNTGPNMIIINDTPTDISMLWSGTDGYTSSDFVMGALINAYVRLLSGSSIYGDSITLNYAFYDSVSGGSLLNLTPDSGAIGWDINLDSSTVRGTYDLSYTGDFALSGYNIAAGAATSWEIQQRDITLTANNQTKTYGDALALSSNAFSISAGSLANSDTITGATLASQGGYDLANGAAGTYTGDITIANAAGTGGFNSDNYNITYAAGDFTVNKRAIELTASNQSKTYGDALTLGTTAYSLTAGTLANGETITGVTLASDGNYDQATGAAGNHTGDITIIDATGANGFDSKNYAITRVAGDLNVDKRVIELTASSQTIAYGDALKTDTSAFTLSSGSMASGESITTVSLSAPSAEADVGSYVDDIQLTGATAGSGGFDAANYTININANRADLTINKRDITLTANDQTVVVGTAPNTDSTAFTVSSGSYVSGESVTGIVLDPNTKTEIGSYTDGLEITGLASFSGGFKESNYNVSYVNGDLTINAKPFEWNTLDLLRAIVNSQFQNLTAEEKVNRDRVASLVQSHSKYSSLSPLDHLIIRMLNLAEGGLSSEDEKEAIVATQALIKFLCANCEPLNDYLVKLIIQVQYKYKKAKSQQE